MQGSSYVESTWNRTLPLVIQNAYKGGSTSIKTKNRLVTKESQRAVRVELKLHQSEVSRDFSKSKVLGQYIFSNTAELIQVPIHCCQVASPVQRQRRLKSAT